jgi:hypothetical protein
MSRNHKDKYENANPRRTHTFMSSEDAAAGKKSHWPELEITGIVCIFMCYSFSSLYNDKKYVKKRERESDTYLATDSRHRWSVQMTMKNN